MSTFLSLCSDVARESGGAGSAPVSVLNQTGRQAKIVQWVVEAWRDIQNERNDWSFLQGEWQGQLIIGSSTYTGASFNIDRFAAFVGDTPGNRPTTLYDPAIGVADEGCIHQMSFQTYRTVYGRGAQLQQRSTRYCLDPQGAIRFGSTPDKQYIVRGEYRKGPQILAADADVPDMPDRFHRRIVTRAIVLMAQHDEAPAALQIWGGHDLKLRIQMVNELVPDLDVRAEGPLA